MRVKDIYSSAFLCLAGLLCIFWVIPNYCPPGDGFGVPPSTLPYTLCGVIVALSVLTFIKAVTIRLEEKTEKIAPQALKRVGLLILALVLVIPAFEYLGFIATGALFLLALQWLLGQRNWLVLIGLSAGLPCLLYLLLWHFLRVPLP